MFRVRRYRVHFEPRFFQHADPFAWPVLAHVRLVVQRVQPVHRGVDEVILGHAAIVDYQAAALA